MLILNIDPYKEGFDPRTKLGLGFGVFYKLKVGGALTKHPELNFKQQGTKAEKGTLKSTISLNYLQIPVLIKYRFGDLYALNFFVQAVPNLGMVFGTPILEFCNGRDCGTTEYKYWSEEEIIKAKILISVRCRCQHQ